MRRREIANFLASSGQLTSAIAAICALALNGCTPQEVAPAPDNSAAKPASRTDAAMVKFTDVTAQSGIKTRHFSGAFGAALLPETMGSGCAIFDYDGDGLQDIFLVNGRSWTPAEIGAYLQSPMGAFEKEVGDKLREKNPQATTRAKLPSAPTKSAFSALYRNNGDGTFTDVSAGSGLQIPMHGMGAAAADYDGDGRTDLCVTAYGELFLFRNQTGPNGKAKFVDARATSGVTDNAWNTSAAFFDYDHDGRLDLFICRYVKYTPATDIYRSVDRKIKSYGWPKDYPSQTSLLLHNEGNGKFKDVSASAGISRRIENGEPIEGAALGVVVCDPNKDGWPDLVVANDLRPNFYFVNQKNGKFAEQAAKSGLAMGPEDKPRGGMGIDNADIDHSGDDSIVIGHFNAEGLGFWHSDEGAFREVADPLGLKESSITSLTFGLLFTDLNNDGWPDLVAANGHVDPTVHNYLRAIYYRQPPLLYLNETAGAGQKPNFHEVGAQAGLTDKMVARGLASIDFDNDGDLDLLFTSNGELPRLFRNDGTGNNSTRITLRGKAPNLNAIGAHIDALVGKEIVRRDVRSGSSYLSQSELPVTIGAGQEASIAKLRVVWPDGAAEEFADVKTGENITLEQGKGIVARAPFVGNK